MLKRKDQLFLVFVCFMMILTNVAFLGNQSNQSFYLHSDFWEANSYWQIITHFFAHLSLYHLCSNGLVFLILFYELCRFQNAPTYKLLFFCGLSSTTAAMLNLELHGVSTFGGISGVNYGLLVFVCLQYYVEKNQSPLFKYGALAVFIYVIVEQVLETCFQQSFYHQMHLGFVGTPITESHAGGILAALLLFVFCNHPKTPSNKPTTNKDFLKLQWADYEQI